METFCVSKTSRGKANKPRKQWELPPFFAFGGVVDPAD
jgi:hypothetical protein